MSRALGNIIIFSAFWRWIALTIDYVTKLTGGHCENEKYLFQRHNERVCMCMANSYIVRQIKTNGDVAILW